ncbi:MAG: hypothetical protein PHV62_01815 [Sulfuricurvum sp.]|nr:hypothetical protein [Sulfuricurvum sp.]
MQSITISTYNIPDELKKIALQEHVSLDALTFDLLYYQTQYKGIVDEEWKALDGDDLEQITTEVEIRSKIFLLRQEYQIRVYPAAPHPHFDLRFSIAYNKYRTKIVAVIDPTSKIPLKKGIQEYLKETIYRKKLRNGYMIGITDQTLDQEIKALLLKIQKEGPFNAPYRLPIATFYSPTPPTNDNIILHYKKIARENNLVDGVEVDDLIFEYIFAVNGIDGRSCTGEHIYVGEPLIRYQHALGVDHQTIRAEEDHHSIRFYATKSGYIERKNGVFTVSHDLILKSASFKSTGSMEAGQEKEINIKIGEGEDGEDAVGSGVNIDVQTLDVKGTIGSNTKIQACEVTIGAQTHKKSLIEVQENATIHLHRGNLKAKNATINILEAGTIEAETVYVKNMSGGEIIAQRVIIEILYSNAKITALESIEIRNIEGNGNELIINPRAIPSYLDQISVLESELASKQFEVQQKGKDYLQKEIALQEQHVRIKKTMENIKKATQENRLPNKADKIRVMQYKHAVTTLHNEKIMIKAHEEAIHAFEHKLDKLYDADLHAIVTYHKEYNGNTRIQFIDPKTQKIHAVSPHGKVTHIRLRKEGDEKKFFFES